MSISIWWQCTMLKTNWHTALIRLDLFSNAFSINWLSPSECVHKNKWILPKTIILTILQEDQLMGMGFWMFHHLTEKQCLRVLIPNRLNGTAAEPLIQDQHLAHIGSFMPIQCTSSSQRSETCTWTGSSTQDTKIWCMWDFPKLWTMFKFCWTSPISDKSKTGYVAYDYIFYQWNIFKVTDTQYTAQLVRPIKILCWNQAKSFDLKWIYCATWGLVLQDNSEPWLWRRLSRIIVLQHVNYMMIWQDGWEMEAFVF